MRLDIGGTLTMKSCPDVPRVLMFNFTTKVVLEFTVD
jgi:hypothetical protein